MGGKPVDRLGKRYGRLRVVARAAPAKSGKKMWLCRCDCGQERIVQCGNLHNGHTTSCGCAPGNYTDREMHGWSRTPEHHIWIAMKVRCNDPFEPRYGGRGIKVCDRWQNSFLAFLQDMGSRPTPEHSLDRYPDNDGPYSPENCRWATVKEQNRNKCDNRKYTYNGKTLCLADWAQETGIKRSTLVGRLERNGWTFEEAITRPLVRPRWYPRKKTRP